MRRNGRMGGTAETGAIGNLAGSSRGTLPLLPTACVAICLAAGSLYWRGAPPRAPEGQIAAMQPLPPGADLFRIVPDGEGRVRAPYPLEFEQQFPLLASLPAEAAAPVLPVLESREPETKEIGTKEIEAKEAETRAVRRAAPHRPRAVPSLAGVRPPARPDDLKVAKVTPDKENPDKAPNAEAASRTASAAERPASWLPFAPTGRLMTQSMVALGEGVTNAGAAMIDLIDRRR